jgi:hypothetical protein
VFFLYVAAAVVLLAVVSVLLTRAAVKLMGKLGGETIYRLHESAEFISRTHRVPPSWREAAEERIALLGKQGIDDDRLGRTERRARWRCLRQLEKLLHFVDNSSTIADEEARNILRRELLSAFQEWRRQSWSEMIGA